MDGDAEDEGFAVVTVPMDSYVDGDRFAEVHEVVAEADAVARLLSDWGGEYRAWKGEDRTLGAAQVRLREWSSARPPRNSMLLWFGHGESNQDDALLAVRGAGTDGEDDSVTPEELGKHLVDNFRRRAVEDRWAVVVVEACGAARFVEKLLAYVLQRRAAVRLLLIGSGADQGSGYVASFREVLTRVLAEFSDNYSHIRLRDLAQRIQDLLSPGRVLCLLEGDEQVARRNPAGRPVIMTLEDYARPRGELLPSPEPAGSAPAEAVVPPPRTPVEADAPTGELSWFFVGRTEERSRIADWLAAADHGLLAVTGPPGCGKSALLGHILLRTGRSAEPATAGDAPRHEPWPVGVPLPRADTFLNLTGASVRQVVGQLAQVFAVPAPPDTAGDDERIRALLDAVRSGGRRRRTLFADGLDASADPNRLADLLRLLGALPGVRVVAGTRPSSADSLDVPRAVTEDLLDGLGCDAANTLRLRPDPQDLAIYVREVLRAERAAFQHLDIDLEAAVQRVGVLVVAPQAGAERDFLYATLAVHEIIADPSLLLDSRRADLADLLGKDHRRLFAAVVRRLQVALPGSTAVLRALAFAQGHGLPRAERIWATVASALSDTPVDAGLLEAVAQAAAPYIMLDAEDGQAVYRLAHRTFRDFLLGDDTQAGDGQTGDRQDDATQDTARARDDRLAVVTALTRLAATKDERMTALPRPHPYLLRHLSAHAAEAGPRGWRVLADHPGVLDHLDPAALAGAALRSGAGLGALPPAVTGALALVHLAVTAGPGDRRGLRELGTWRTTGAAPAPPAQDYDGPAAPWTVRWAALQPHAPHVTLADLHVPMRSLRVLARRTDGRQLLVGAGDAGVVRAWDLSTGLETAPALRGGPQDGSQWVLAPLCGPSGKDWLAAAGDDRTLRLWDVLTGRPANTEYSLLGDAVRAMAPFAGKLAIGDLQGRLWLFDPAEEREDRHHRTGHRGPVHGITVYTLPGPGPRRERLVTADGKGWVLVWRLDRRRFEREWRAHDTGVHAVTTYTDPQDGVVLATAGRDGTVRLWDPRDGRELGRLAGHEGPVHAVTAYTDPEDGVVLATAGRDGTVRLWDPRDERELGRLAGHEGPVHAVTAYMDPQDGVVLATAGQDGTVRLWGPRAGSAVGQPAPPPSPVRALAEAVDPADGGLLCVAYADGGVARFGAADGARRTAPDPGGPVVAMASLEDTAGGWLLATAHTDGSVRIGGVADAAERIEAAVPAGPAPGGGPVQFLAGLRLADGQQAFAGLTESGGLCWWDARTGTLLGAADTGLPGPFTALTAIPYGATTALAVTGEGGHHVWWSASPDGHWNPLFPGHTGRLAAPAVVRGPTAGHRALVTVSREGELRVWDRTGTRLLHTVRLGLRCHALTALGEGQVAVGTQDGIVVLGLDPSAWADEPGEEDTGLSHVVFGERADRPSGVA
ncbi:AAA family ATPase [Streptomyces sp. NPDC001410]|uniref:AAA family ATPase n=1 Tax=Streptomyces sp. NPDC001410 TaxID=3364574 RepID=UPI0036900BAF